MFLSQKQVRFFSYLFIILVVMCIGYAMFNYTTHQQQMSNFRTYEISGHIKELILVTTFPNEGLYVGFDTGDFHFINVNYWWAYSHLSLIQPWNNVTLTYERNNYGNCRLLHIQEVGVIE